MPVPDMHLCNLWLYTSSPDSSSASMEFVQRFSHCCRRSLAAVQSVEPGVRQCNKPTRELPASGYGTIEEILEN